jgi:hypothetical protein
MHLMWPDFGPFAFHGNPVQNAGPLLDIDTFEPSLGSLGGFWEFGP